MNAGLLHGLIHGRRDSVIIVTGHEFREGSGVEFAARGLDPRSEPLGIFKDIVRNGNSGFHTGRLIVLATWATHVAVGGQGMSADDEMFNLHVAKSFQNLDEMRIIQFLSTEGPRPFPPTHHADCSLTLS